MIPLTKPIAALLIAASPGASLPRSLSPEAAASKAAFEALLKQKEGVAEARTKSLGMPGTREYLASEEGMMGFIALAQSFEKNPAGAGEAFRTFADLLPKIDHLRGWDGYQSIYLVRAARKSADPPTSSGPSRRRTSARGGSRRSRRSTTASPWLTSRATRCGAS